VIRQNLEMSFHPYLNFGGNCREAFTRYQEIFGGELALMEMGDIPGNDEGPAGQRNLIAHAALMCGGDLLMASDAFDDPFPPVQGMYVNFSTADVAEAHRVFEALAEGGRVDMPIATAFFSPAFGLCTDRFGTPWMVVAQSGDQPG